MDGASVKFEQFKQSVNSKGICRAISFNYLLHVLGCQKKEVTLSIRAPMPQSGWLPPEVLELSPGEAELLYRATGFTKDLRERSEAADFLIEPRPQGPLPHGFKTVIVRDLLCEEFLGWGDAAGRVVRILEWSAETEKRAGFVLSFHYTKREDGDPYGGHAIAIDVTRAHEYGLHVMDPNQGVWQFKNPQDLSTWLLRDFQDAMLCDEFGRLFKEVDLVRLMMVQVHEPSEQSPA